LAISGDAMQDFGNWLNNWGNSKGKPEGYEEAIKDVCEYINLKLK
jgi:hypothetical protein